MNVAYHKKNLRKETPKANQSWRFMIVYTVLGAVFICLASYIAMIQIISPEYSIAQANKRSLRVQEIPPTRGMITDREGRPFAVSIPVKAVWIDPKFVLEQGGVEHNDKWQALADTLGITVQEILAKVADNPSSRFTYLARQVSIEKANYIQQLKLKGIGFKEESKRYYPTGPLVAQIVGITNRDEKGIEGIELSFENWLQGVPGERTIRKDKSGRVVETLDTIDSLSGQNLTLSIDERLQNIVFREISKAVEVNKAVAATAVLLDVHTGEVLAMASAPTYNPNMRQSVDDDLKRNRAITDVFEPGSTVKPLVVMAGLERGVIQPNTVLNTMPFVVNGKQIKDVSRQAQLSITGVLQKSSNTGVSRIALALQPDDLVDIYKKFGFAQPTRLGLVGEQSGYYPTKNRWSDIERASFSYGYGLMITPMQLAKAYATIGSYGISRPLSITRVDPPVSGEQVFNPDTVRTVLHMMETVTHPGGGGVKAAVKDYRVAVKTGTAKKVENGVYVDKYIAYTAGVAPVSNPRYSLVVVINEPSAGEYFGGAVSAPVFSSIMGGVLRTMNIPPDGIEMSIEDPKIVVNTPQPVTLKNSRAVGG
ncbi:peptidoglycan glycosyltransferase FtsI [Thorsellia anophelis]|uniref:Peptidoglycan D,D-transpeptidase FtsI n=1 Tax=Thorsellia anophelis DSM 18579 TaxID=1123402 RepID=A0A1H9ZCU4_9GAMM|nr:peptidoglycan glycosyltransferase FtsI [Thorsellia anophelis]SES79163.1 cell division protein FtsI (penicillin-binding protein 3) [Thorsellia anophelis DSM 18579]